MRSKGPYLRCYAEASLVRALMTVHGISGYRELADRAGIGRETARQFTIGGMVDTAVPIAESLAKVLQVDIDELFIKRRVALGPTKAAA